jgi:hypothetical protein
MYGRIGKASSRNDFVIGLPVIVFESFNWIPAKCRGSDRLEQKSPTFSRLQIHLFRAANDLIVLFNYDYVFTVLPKYIT